jgi:hypothetical protein
VTGQQYRWGIWTFLLLTVFLTAQPAFLRAAEFRVTQMECKLVEGTYVLDAAVDYKFSEKALEALENGVPLTLEVHLQLRRKGAWLWEEDELDSRLRFQLRYHALASLYQLLDLQSGEQQSFATRDAAIVALGEIQSLPVIAHRLLEPGEEYDLRLRTVLDIDALPLPLRPMAYLSPSWNLSSKSKTWRITP